jgi:hypothetical protein
VRSRSLTAAHILRARLYNQRLVGSDLEQPEDAVGWLGAVQAQEYGPALWSLGLRLRPTTAAAIDAAVDAGRLVRTHVLRPTWHFVRPQDLRWLLALTRDRVHAASGFRALDLDRAVLARCRRVIERAFRGHAALTRRAIAAALEAAGIAARDVRLGHIMMHAELEGLICSGPRAGKQFTYALVDARVPGAPPRRRDEALADLTTRFFSSHGPATLRDFAWWSGLTQADGRRGLEMQDRPPASVELDGDRYWFVESAQTIAPSAAPAPRRRARLLPTYDEYLVAYQRRAALFGRNPLVAQWQRTTAYTSALLLDARLAGSWRATSSAAGVSVAVAPDRPLSSPETRAITRAAADYAQFLQLPVSVAIK